MSDATATIGEQTALLELEKLKIEISQLQRPPSFLERNWQGIVTAMAAVLAAFGGLAALVSTVSQVADLWTHVGQERDIVGYEKREADAEKNAVANEEQVLASKKSEVDEADKLSRVESQLKGAQSQISASQALLHFDRTVLIPGAIQSGTQDRRAGALVYLQYSDTASLPAMQALQTKLISLGYVVPGIELVPPSLLDKSQPDEVRYFTADDKPRAEKVAKAASVALSKLCRSHPVVLPQLHTVSDPKAAPLEIWLGFGCDGTPAQH